jgi:uncharacterized membrane protein
MRISWRTELPHWLLLAAQFVLAAVTWPYAPDQIPVHWNIQGEIDRYGGRFEGLLALPLVSLGTYLLLLLLPRVDPARANYAHFAGPYAVIRFVTLAFLTAVYGLIHLTIRGYPLDVEVLVPLGVGSLFVVLGNFMGKLRPNWFVGIRTPWTLTSKESWGKTHRLGGWLFIAGGLAMAGAGLSRSNEVFVATCAAFAAGALLLLVYSYRVWRADPRRGPPAGFPAAYLRRSESVAD